MKHKHESLEEKRPEGKVRNQTEAFLHALVRRFEAHTILPLGM